MNTEKTSHTYYREFCVPCDCSQGTTATGQCSWTSNAFCSGVGTPCVCSEPPPTSEWGWSPELAHVVDTGRENLGHPRQQCRLRSPHFHVARVGESEGGFPESTTLSSTSQWRYNIKDQPSRRYKRRWRFRRARILIEGWTFLGSHCDRCK